MRRIKTFCPICMEEKEGYLQANGNMIMLAVKCQDHSRSYPFFKNKNLYLESDKMVHTYSKQKYRKYNDFDNRYIKHSTHIQIDVTTDCNLNCLHCFAKQEKSHNISWDKIKSELIKIPKPKKHCIVLIGGEPTLREDLPELIKNIKSLGFTVKLATNGIKLRDIEYLEKLKASGLDWVVLQFDGMSDEIYRTLRGKNLLDLKFQVLKNLEQIGFRIQLAVMIKKDINLREIPEIIKLAFSSNNIFWVSFYPHSETTSLKNGSDSYNSTLLGDVVEKFIIMSKGLINIKDLIKIKKFWSIIYFFTRNSKFKPKNCHFPFIIFMQKDNKILPINRFFEFRFILKNFRIFLKFLLNIPKFLGFNNKKISKEFLFISIEKFYDFFNIDLDEIKNCHNIYLTEKGFIPVCLYNSRYRSCNK